MTDSDKAYRQRRIADELYRRSLDGAPFYALGCALVAAVGNQPWPAYWIHGAAVLLYLLSGWFRISDRVPQVDPGLPAWKKRRFLIIHAGCLLWSVVLWRTLAIDGAQSTALLVALICTAGYGAATAIAFSMEPRQALITLVLLVVPSVLALATSPAARPLALTLFLYSIYLVISLSRSGKAFAAQLDLECDLRASRAEIERLTLQDSLTGLANRRALDLEFQQAWNQAHRRRAPLSLLLADIDHFKRINDAHGHAAGDACLLHFAELMRRHFRRAGDLPVRLGGEEFVVVLEDCNLEDAEYHAEAFRRLVESEPGRFDGQAFPMTVSVGVATARWDGHDRPDNLLKRADDACYLAKHSGRNRVLREPA